MPEIQTYEPIQTFTLESVADRIQFDNIPQTYSDLILVGSGARDGGPGMSDIRPVINNDVNQANYSYNGISPNIRNGTVYIDEFKSSTYNGLLVDYYGSPKTALYTHFNIIHFMNYSSSNHYKMVYALTGLYDFPGGDSAIHAMEHVSSLWKNNSAITSIRYWDGGSNFKAGSRATLFGIKA